LRKKYKDKNRKLTGGKIDKYNWMVMYDEPNEKRQQLYVDLGFCARNHLNRYLTNKN
jgi:hypothetical protein